jgi:hypothetical protein
VGPDEAPTDLCQQGSMCLLPRRSSLAGRSIARVLLAAFMARRSYSRVRVDMGPPHDQRRSSLPALRWIAEEDLVYDGAANTLHRPGCAQLAAASTCTNLSGGCALELVWAPRLCECRPT